MKPAPRSDAELLAWVSALIEREQRNETHGEIRIQIKGGQIMSVKTEACHLPPRREAPNRET